MIAAAPANIRHPAKYSDCLLPIFAEILRPCRLILDPFAGTGKLRKVRPDAVLIELEYPWACQAGAIQGNALYLPFAAATFNAVCTSPTYGNRMADHFTDHQTGKGYRRNTYRHALGQPLHPDNSGAMQWGEEYRKFHESAWLEVRRVLRPGGLFVLNISDHIRGGKSMDVSRWHALTLLMMGFECIDRCDVFTPRNRQGQNGDVRVNCEYIYTFRRGVL